MKLLVLDFLRRWWWMFALLCLLSFSTTIGGFPFALGPAAMICLLLDAGRGVFRVVRPLPVPRREQAQTWWLLGVLAVPLVTLLPIVLGSFVYLGIHGPVGDTLVPPQEITSIGSAAPPMSVFIPTYSPWFAAAIQVWVGLGFAGFCFLLGSCLPTRPPEGAWESLGAMLVGGLWGLSIPGATMLLPQLPRTPSALLPWHWALVASVPFWVVISYFTAPDLLRRRTLAPATGRKPAAAATPAECRGHVTGVPLYLANFLGRSALMLLFISLVQVLFTGWINGRTPTGPFAAIQTVCFAIIFSAVSGEWGGLRMLRALPLSTTQLAALLMASPLSKGVIAAALASSWYGFGDPAVPTLANFTAQMLAISGLGALALAGMLHIASGLRLLVVIFAMWISAGLFFLCAKMPLWLALAGVVALGLAWFALLRGLRKSNAFYQPRRFFGVSIGQPNVSS
jgi:hypothetical protein